MTETKQSPILGFPVPVLGVTGEMYTGKTLFLSSLCPEETLMIDCEESSATYAIPFKRRISLFEELAKEGKSDWKPIDAFKWFHKFISDLPAGEYRVLALDPLSDMEVGLPDYVSTKYADYGFNSADKFEDMGGVYWGHVNNFWKQFLGQLSSKVEMFAFSTHKADVYKGKERTGQRKAKGKKVVSELCSLYVEVVKNVDASTGKPNSPIPRGIVLKSRLAHTKFVDGQMKIIPILPPVLDECTPATIRKYVEQPPDWNKLKKTEYEPPRVQTEEEKLEMQREIAEANARAEEAKLQYAELNLSAAEKVKRMREEAAKKQQVDNAISQAADRSLEKAETPPEENKQLNGGEREKQPPAQENLIESISNPFAVQQDKDSSITAEQAAFLESQFETLGIGDSQKSVILSRTKSDTVSELPFWRASEISAKFTDMIAEKGLSSGK